MGLWVLAATIVLAGTIGAGLAYLRLKGRASDTDGVANRVAEVRAENIEQSVANLMTAQSELAGRISQLAEAQTRTQATMMHSVEERLDAVKLYMGRSLTEQTDRTSQTLHQLHTRLSLIDDAQRNISELSTQVTSLQDVLGNNKARGLFGEMQMRDLVTSSLPPSAYSFQKTLANGRTADCLIELPNPPGPMVIDARFPLETYHVLRNAKTDADRTQAERSFRNAVLKHVVDIAERYIVSGDTAESALMFVPSEAVYAELHSNFPDVVEKSFRARVWIVSPTTLMATLNTVRAVLKDTRMREQAQIIHKETGLMLDDVSRLQKRVLNLQAHFGQTERDIREVLIAADKIARRAERIEEVQIGAADTHAYIQQPAPSAPIAQTNAVEAPKTEVKAADAKPAAPVVPAHAPVKPAAMPSATLAAAPAPAPKTEVKAAPAPAAKPQSTEGRDPASVWANLWLSAMTGSKTDAKAETQAGSSVPAEKPLTKAEGVTAAKTTAPKVPNAFLPDPVKPAAGKEAAQKPAVTARADNRPVSQPTPIPPSDIALSFADIAEDLAEFGVPLAPLVQDAPRTEAPAAPAKPAAPAGLTPLKKPEPVAPSTLAKAASPSPAASKLYPAGLNPFVSPAPAKPATPAAAKLPTDSKIELPKTPASTDAAPKPFTGAGHAIYFPAMSMAPKSAETPAADATSTKPYVKNAAPKATADLKGKSDAEKRTGGDSSIPDDEPDFDIDFDDRPTIWPLV